MKKIIPFIFCTLFYLNNTKAQDQNCDATAIMNVKGSWKKRSDANMKADKNQQLIISRIDAISKIYQTTYAELKGIEAGWYRTMESSVIINGGSIAYQFNSLYPVWYCNSNLHKLMVGGETGTWSIAYINSFGWFMTDQRDKAALMIDGVQAWLLPKKMGEWKGLSLYEPTASIKGNKAVLITRNNQLPYKPVSRLQFLQSMKAKIETEEKAQVDILQKQPVWTDAEENAARQKGLENAVKNSPPSRIEQRKADYLKNYKTAQQRKEETIQLAKKYFDGRIKPLTDELNKESSTDVQQPAIVNNDYNGIFGGFTTDEKGGRMIVVVNSDYFKKNLPNYIPQLIVLYWSWENNMPSLNFKKEFEENFPVDKLKAMIDK